MQMDSDAPIGSGPDQQFQNYLGQGEFRLQQCDQCQQFIFYPRVLCPHCGASELSWNAVSGQGVVYSSTVVRRREEKGGPYNVAIIELAEGPRMMSRVEGVAADQVAIGSAVSARIETEMVQKDERHIILFDLAQAAQGAN
ncbi:MAG: OB-fold domain-containing protein [Immundisolibacteraceae bacterium]|nr:OB-fold domain-containing protein [Immundisolibacteraceae bacterium]